MSNNLKIRKFARNIYVLVIVVLIITTLLALYDGGYHKEGGTIAAIALVSILTSLLPFFISMYFFRQHEAATPGKNSALVPGLILFAFCFPVKILIIYSNVSLLFGAESNWSLG